MSEETEADLLVTCKQLEKAFDRTITIIVNSGPEVAGRFQDAMNELGIEPGVCVRARAAIAKAEGRTP